MAISSLTGCSFNVGFTWTAQNPLTGTDYQPLTNSGAIRKSQNYGTAAVNSALGGANELVTYNLPGIAGSGNTTIDLSSLTDILQQTGISFFRLKGFMIRLLSVADDSVNGTACSSVTVGNAAANPFLFNTWAGTTPTQRIYNGGIWLYFDTQAAGFVVGSTVNIKILNNDSVVAAKVQLTLIGGTT